MSVYEDEKTQEKFDKGKIEALQNMANIEIEAKMQSIRYQFADKGETPKVTDISVARTSTEPTPESQTFEEIVKRHTHHDGFGVLTVELPFDTLVHLHNTALDAARTDQWEKDRIEIVEREQAARRQQEVKIWDDLGVMKLGLRFNDKITELVITDEQYDHLRSFIADLTKDKAE